MRMLVHFGLWTLGLAAAETQTTEAERDCLAHYAAGKKHLAEIGVWHGVTTCRLRQVMASDGTLWAIDPYPPGRLGFSMQRVIARREVTKISVGALKWMRLTGIEAARNLASSRPFDFVFTDGDHTYQGLQADWTGWRPLVASGGVVALHDSRSTPERPIEGVGSVLFTREMISSDRGFEVIDAVDSLTVVRRAHS